MPDTKYKSTIHSVRTHVSVNAPLRKSKIGCYCLNLLIDSSSEYELIFLIGQNIMA